MNRPESAPELKPLEGDVRAHSFQMKGAKAYQEDAVGSFWKKDETIIVACVYDGHGGINGRVASTCCVNLTRKWFDDRWGEMASWSDDDWVSELEAFFTSMHDAVRDEFVKLEQARRVLSGQPCDNPGLVDDDGIVRKHTGFPVHGGTTGTICILINLEDRRRAICANVGDSDCLLLPKNQKGNRNPYKHLSVDHGPDSVEEYWRIQNLNLETSLIFVYDKQGLKKHECPPVFDKAGIKDPEYVRDPWGMGLRPTNVRYDPGVYAVTPAGVGEDTTCIAMTRSLGDLYAHQFGMTHIPSVTFEELDLHEEYVITVGSDGVWDCWKWADFADFLNGCLAKYQLEKGTEAVIQHTVARAKACFGAKSFDDASLAVLHVKPKGSNQ